jgi:hypothetical protein
MSAPRKPAQATEPARVDASPRGGILEALRRSPLVGADLDFTRTREEDRHTASFGD